MFSVRITSKCRGRETSCIAALSTSRCSSGHVRVLLGVHALTTSRHSREVSRTFALSTLVTLRARPSRTPPARSARPRRRSRRRCRGRVAVAAAVAEVDAAGELADDEQVGALDPLAACSGLASSSAGLGRTGRRFANSPSPLRRPSRPCSGRGALGVGGVPLRPADRGQQHGVGAAAGLEHLVGEGRAVGVDRGAADQLLLELEVTDRASTRSAAAMISGPIPSPGRVTTRCGTAGTVSGPAEPGVQRAPRMRPGCSPLNGSVPAASCTPENEPCARA